MTKKNTILIFLFCLITILLTGCKVTNHNGENSSNAFEDLTPPSISKENTPRIPLIELIYSYQEEGQLWNEIYGETTDNLLRLFGQPISLEKDIPWEGEDTATKYTFTDLSVKIYTPTRADEEIILISIEIWGAGITILRSIEIGIDADTLKSRLPTNENRPNPIYELEVYPIIEHLYFISQSEYAVITLDDNSQKQMIVMDGRLRYRFLINDNDVITRCFISRSY